MTEKTREQELSELTLEVRGHFIDLNYRLNRLRRNFKELNDRTENEIRRLDYQLDKIRGGLN